METVKVHEGGGQLAGIEKLTSIIRSTSSPAFILDIDDTIKEPRKDGLPKRFHSKTALALKKIHENGISIGIATEQAPFEIEPFISALATTVLGDKANPYELFNGVVIAEGGALVKRAQSQEYRFLVGMGSQVEKQKLADRIEQEIAVSKEEDGWGTLVGLANSVRVKLPDANHQGKATLSIWEEGFSISTHPEFKEKYFQVQEFVERIMQSLGVSFLKAFEAGNGTLRIVPKNISKHHTAGLLHSFRIIDLSSSIFVGDGPNDILLARKIQEKGGGVIAVANAVDELKEVADYITESSSGIGFAEAISKIFNS